MPLVSGRIGRQAYVSGDWSKGLLSAGHALAFVDRLEPLAAIVGRLEAQLREALQRLAPRALAVA
jgi:nitronate monooxygenase